MKEEAQPCILVALSERAGIEVESPQPISGRGLATESPVPGRVTAPPAARIIHHYPMHAIVKAARLIAIFYSEWVLQIRLGRIAWKCKIICRGEVEMKAETEINRIEKRF